MYNASVHFHQYFASFPPNKPPKCQNWNFDQIRQTMEIMFIYLPNTSRFIHFQSVQQKKWNIHNKTDKYLNTTRFIHFQSVQQKKWNIHNKTDKYQWHFRSILHQTTSLTSLIRFYKQNVELNFSNFKLRCHEVYRRLYLCRLFQYSHKMPIRRLILNLFLPGKKTAKNSQFYTIRQNTI